MAFAASIIYLGVSLLPAALQFLVAMLACSLNEWMQRKLDCTREKARILEEHFTAVTSERRIILTPDEVYFGTHAHAESGLQAAAKAARQR